jgi:hypothetical protein
MVVRLVAGVAFRTGRASCTAVVQLLRQGPRRACGWRAVDSTCRVQYVHQFLKGGLRWAGGFHATDRQISLKAWLG